MKKIILLSLLIGFSSCKVMESFYLEPTTLETVTALKEVLNSSMFGAIKSLKQLNDKGPEAVLPEEFQPVVSTLKTLGLGKEIENVTQQVSRVSGLVLDESSGIVSDAIKEVNFTDAVAVVVGGQDAATDVLRNAMYGAVKNRYSARLDAELNKTDANKYWPIAANTYNLFAKNKVDSSLSDFIAERSVDALFLAMGKEESRIRRDPKSLGKAVVTKVFEYYKNRQS